MCVYIYIYVDPPEVSKGLGARNLSLRLGRKTANNCEASPSLHPSYCTRKRPISMPMIPNSGGATQAGCRSCYRLGCP